MLAIKNSPVGQYLVNRGLITEKQLQEVLEYQKENLSAGKYFGDYLVELGFMDEVKFTKVLAEKLDVPYVDISEMKIDILDVKKVPEVIAKKHTIIAISILGRRITVATSDPINFYISEEVKAACGMDVVPVMATKSSILIAINKFYAMQNVDSALESATDQIITEEDLNISEEEALSDRIDNAPIVKLATNILDNSFKQGASDIHIEPFKTYTKIRIRIDGELVELVTISKGIHSALTTRFKIISGMNIAEKRIPQDGRFSQVVDGITLDVRVSSLPTVNGEKMVMRILSTGDVSVRKISDLGMNNYNLEMFSRMLKCPHGVILVTGPTGSGKTTTLYSALGEIAKPNINVITVEDPVEKNVEGINQCQVNVKAGMTFSSALRSILRQDPDIVMIGEMRDSETAEIGIRAAITGHLVLSTLHTNDAASTIIRLCDMGIPAYLVATSLIGVVAQRLIKLLCPECKKARLTIPAENELLGISKSVTIYDAVGCKHCNSTGYKSRTAIHEIILSTADMSALIANGGTGEEISNLAKKNGTKLLRDNVSELIINGDTTIEELVKTTYSV